MKILITGGHGGIDPGACGNNYYERDIAYEFVKLVSNYINTNYSNISVDYQHEKNDNGDFYSDYGNSKYEHFLSFHFNAGGGQGTENLIKYSNSLATVINSALSKHFTNRGVKYRQDLYVLNIGFDTLTEVCFIDSESDMKYYENNKNKIVEDVSSAIADKLGGKKVQETINAEITNIDTNGGNQAIIKILTNKQDLKVWFVGNKEYSTSGVNLISREYSKGYLTITYAFGDNVDLDTYVIKRENLDGSRQDLIYNTNQEFLVFEKSSYLDISVLNERVKIKKLK